MTDDPKRHSSEDRIDQSLKSVYDEVLKAEIPDRFKDLLAQLKAQDSEQGSGNGK